MEMIAGKATKILWVTTRNKNDVGGGRCKCGSKMFQNVYTKVLNYWNLQVHGLF